MEYILAFAVAALSISPVAFAKEVELQGPAAESFIYRHFPDADIPGPVQGVFHYTNKRGQVKCGYAECFVPAMGEASDGVVSSCSVIY